MKYREVAITNDEDGHIYVVPIEFIEDFHKLLEESYKTDDFQEVEDKYEKYATGGSISQVRLFVESVGKYNE